MGYIDSKKGNYDSVTFMYARSTGVLQKNMGREISREEDVKKKKIPNLSLDMKDSFLEEVIPELSPE